MKHSGLDVAKFHEALDTVRTLKSLSWRGMAKAAGVSASTLTRMATVGRKPDVDTFMRLLAWTKLSADRFHTKDR